MYYIGIDLGGTNIAAGLVNDRIEIVRKASIPTGAQRTSGEIVKDMAKLCQRLLREEGLSAADLAYIGIATPGIANSDTGCVEYSCNLPFRNYPIAEELKKAVGVSRVLIENDANAAAKGEAVAGSAKGVANSVMITLGTGVGGGIIIDHKVYSGFNYAGAELGHMVIEHDGVSCSCGRRGCWEAYSSATGLINMTKKHMEGTTKKDTSMWDYVEQEGKVSGRTAFAMMKKGDKMAAEVVDEYIRYLAEGVINMINIFQPEVFVIGGGICNEKEYLTKPLIEYIDKYQYNKDKSKGVIVKTALLGNDAGIIGAAMLGI